MYNPTTKVLTTENGLSLNEVAECLGSGSNDLGTLCTHDNIRKWAKYKPVESDAILEVSESERTETLYGLTHPDPVSNYAGTTAHGWSYTRPTTIFRISDFNGYCHRAEHPPILAGVFSHSQVWGGGLTIGSNPYSGVTGYISYDDIPDWYLTAVLTDGTRTFLKTFSDNHPALTSTDIATLVTYGTEWDYYFILCSNSQTTAELPTSLTLSPPAGLLYLPALFDTLSQVQGSLTIDTASGVTMSVTTLVTTNSVTSHTVWPPTVSQFIGVPSSPNPDGTYSDAFLSVSTNYTMALKVKLTNTTDSDIIIYERYLKAKLETNFAAGSPELALKAFYDENCTEIDRVTIPAGESVTVIAALPDNFYKLTTDGQVSPSVAEGQQIWPRVYLTYNMQNSTAAGAAIASVVIRVQN